MTAVLVAGDDRRSDVGRLLSLDGVGGLAGWQWLFLLEGLPASSSVSSSLRADGAAGGRACSHWLTTAERAALTARLEDENEPADVVARTSADALGERTRLAPGARVLHDPGGALRDRFLAAADHQGRGRRERRSRSALLTRHSVSAWPPSAWSWSAGIRTARANGGGTSRSAPSSAALAFAATAFVARRSYPSLAALSLAMLGLASMFGPFWTLATSRERRRRRGRHRAHQLGREHRRVRGTLPSSGTSATRRTASARDWCRSARCSHAGGLLVLAVNQPGKPSV